MFARRKNGRVEDDPLVPHGLIWQATDELDEPAQELPPANPRPAEVLEVPLRQENGLADRTQVTARASSPETSTSAQPDPMPAKLGAISPPIPWPSPKTASVIRRVPPPIVAPPEPTLAVTQLQSARPIVSALPKNAPQAVPLVATGERKNKPTIIRSVRESRQKIARRLQGATHAVAQWASNSYAITAKSVQYARLGAASTYESINLRGQIRRAQHVAEKYTQNGLARSRSAQQGLRSWWAACQPQISSARSAAARFSSITIKASLARSAGFSQRLQNHQLRVRIVKSPLARAAIQRSRLAWVARRQAFRRDPRLWTSLSMAALSALLAIGVISAVSHYGPNADASTKKPSTQAPASVAPASLIAPETASASTRKASSRKTPVHEVQASSAESKRSAVAASEKPKPVTRRAHRNDDEDYVAPDTYHYYGTTGKSR